MPCEEVVVQTERGQLFCRVVGTGSPFIVVHGGPGLSQDYLLPQMAALAETNRVLFYDQHGCGQSVGEINDASICVAAFVDDLESIRKAFGYATISILGHSWGGFLAMHYAIAHPEAVHKLVLLSTVPASSDEFALFAEEVTRRMAPYQGEVDAIERGAAFITGDPLLVERYYRIYFRTYCYNHANADLLNLYMTPKACVSGWRVQKIFERNVFGSYCIHDQLKNISAPTLIVHGDFDPIAPAMAQKIHEEIAGSTFVVLKNCGHLPHVETSEELFNVLRAFVRS
jgi:proline iminopeptidase